MANVRERGTSFLKEFRDFAVKGNAVDLAIGVIIGAAFGAIVSSIVDDIFMPLIGLVLGGVDFSNLFIILSNPNPDVPVPSLTAAQEAGVATLNIGVFINAVVKFAIIAFVLFLVVKGINSMKKKAAEDPKPAAPSREEVLLTEIRDELRSGKPKTMPMAAPRAPSVAKRAAKSKAAAAPKAASKKAPAKKAAAKKTAAKKTAAKKAPAKKAAKAAAAKKAPAKKAPAKKTAAKKTAAKKTAAKKTAAKKTAAKKAPAKKAAAKKAPAKKTASKAAAAKKAPAKKAAAKKVSRAPAKKVARAPRKASPVPATPKM